MPTQPIVIKKKKQQFLLAKELSIAARTYGTGYHKILCRKEVPAHEHHHWVNQEALQKLGLLHDQ